MRRRFPFRRFGRRAVLGPTLWVVATVATSARAEPPVRPEGTETVDPQRVRDEPGREGHFRRFPDRSTERGDEPSPDEETSAADEAEARSLFERGANALAEGRLDDARSLLQRSLELHGHPATAFNLATALTELGRVSAAVELLEGLLNGAYGQLEPSERGEVQTAVNDARARLSELRIEVRGPESARVFIDGEEVDRATDGTLSIALDPGRHRVRVAAEGYADVERGIDLSASATVPLSLTLRPVLGTLVAEAADLTHTIEIEGVALGEGRVRRELPPGTYVVRLPATGTEQTVTLEAGRTTTVRLSDGSNIWNEPWPYIGIGAAALAAIIAVLVLTADDGVIRDENFGAVETLVVPP